MKTRSLLALLLALLMTLCLTTAVAEVAKTLPDAADITVDLNDYYGQKIEGYYNFDCVVSRGEDDELGTADDVVRTAKFYIPDGTVFNQPTVFVGVPGGADSYDFLVSSGWKDLADELKLHIVLMEPENGVWGDADAEIAYINALNEDVSYRPFFCAFSSNFYGIGYGETADLLLQSSINKPKSWAAIAVLGTSGMTKDEAATLEATPSLVPGVTLAQVQTPIWIVANEKTDDIATMIDFYKNANHSAEAIDVDYADEVYLPEEGGTVDDEWCANVVFDAGDWAELANVDYSRTIYKELFEGVYRYPGDSNGALRRPGEIFSRGFEKFEEVVPGGFYEDGSDVYKREWYVYNPESAQEKVESGEKVPLVFVFHGAGGSGNEIADRSGWATVAKERGFIIVMPSGSIEPSVRNVSDMTTSEYFRAMWNTGEATESRPSDLDFVRYLYDWMLEHYEIDTSRVYASGQSSGGMMTWAVSSEMPELFAATAPISANGTTPGGSDGEIAAGAPLPVLCFIGELDTTFRGGFSSDAAKATLKGWIVRNGAVETYDTYTYMEDDSRAPEPDGLFTRYMFHNADGVPVLQAVEVATKTHAILPSECFDAWDNWFVNYSKDVETQTLYYKGEAVNP